MVPSTTQKNSSTAQHCDPKRDPGNSNIVPKHLDHANNSTRSTPILTTVKFGINSSPPRRVQLSLPMGTQGGEGTHPHGIGVLPPLFSCMGASGESGSHQLYCGLILPHDRVLSSQVDQHHTCNLFNNITLWRQLRVCKSHTHKCKDVVRSKVNKDENKAERKLRASNLSHLRHHNISISNSRIATTSKRLTNIY